MKTNELKEGEGLEKNNQEGKEEKKWFGIKSGRVVMLFLIGFLIGMVLKSQATETVTMGFDDYKLPRLESDFVAAPEEVVMEEAEEASQVELGEEPSEEEAGTVREVQ